MYVDPIYLSGEAISGFSVFEDVTILGPGFDIAACTCTLAIGETVVFETEGASAAPLPATGLLLMGALGVAGAALRRRRAAA